MVKNGTAAYLAACRMGTRIMSLGPKRLRCKDAYHNVVPI